MEAADFIATCRRLQAGDFSEAVGDGAAGALRIMNERYGLAATRPDAWNELVQHLTDLAYFTPSRYRAWHTCQRRNVAPPASLVNRLTAAVAAFLLEDEYVEYRLLPAYPDLPAARPAWIRRYLPVLVFRLGGYTSFDGELLPRPHYRIGERTAYGRGLAYRLRVYFHDYSGGRTSRRSPYFAAVHLPLLYSLDNSLGGRYAQQLPARGAERLALPIQEILLSSQLLFDEFRRENRFTPGASVPYYLVYRSAEQAPEIEGKAGARRARKASRQVCREVTHADTGGNRLGVRLLQLSLWRAGFYTGVLDGAYGPQSHAALLALIDQEREAYASNRKQAVLNDRQLDRLAIAVDSEGGGTTWKIDLRLLGKLLDAYAPPPAEEAQEEEDLIWTALEAAGLPHHLDSRFFAGQPEQEVARGAGSEYPDRRVYYGLRGLIRGAFRAVGRILRWVAGTVKEILGAVFDFAKSVTKRLQGGAALFVTGLKTFTRYLFGRPLVSVGEEVDGGKPVLATLFRIDFDVVSLISDSASGEDMRLHQRLLAESQAGLAYFIDTSLGLVGLIGTLQAPIGWLRLGVLLARWVVDRLRLAGPLGGFEEVEQVA